MNIEDFNNLPLQDKLEALNKSFKQVVPEEKQEVFDFSEVIYLYKKSKNK
jgi:hypothetical protein